MADEVDPPLTVKARRLKTWPAWFDQVWRGVKPFELRAEDGDRFEVGELIWLDEWDPGAEVGYTRRHVLVRVTTVLRRSESFGSLQEGYACLGIALEARFDETGLVDLG